MDSKRMLVLDFLQWNDRNGCYTDENCDLEDIPRMTYEEAIKYFFGVMNDDFYSLFQNSGEIEVISKIKRYDLYERYSQSFYIKVS